MKRIDFYIDETLFYHLKNLSGTISEHIRRAVIEYVKKEKQLDVSSSQSKRREDN
jgi:VIT1/CCC1 family predicted Fe2+/Mn2+ transporter